MNGFTKVANAILRDESIDAADKGLLSVLLSFGDANGKSIRPALSTLAKLCGRTEKWVRERIHELHRAGKLCIQERPGRCSIYTIPLPKIATPTPPEKGEAINTYTSRRKIRGGYICPETGLKRKWPLKLKAPEDEQRRT